MVSDKLMCQTLYVLQYTKLQYSNRMSCVYKYPPLSLQSKFKHIFHTFMVTKQIVVLTGHGTNACNMIFELSDVLTIGDQQTTTGNVHVTLYFGTNM